MLPCDKCAYRREIPGSCHTRCGLDWTKTRAKITPANATVPPWAQQWYLWPLNFDPVWEPKECAGYATEIRPGMEAKLDPMQELLSLMGKRVLR